NHTDCPLTDFRGKTSIFSHPVYLFLRKFSLQDSRGGSQALSFCALSLTPSLIPFRYQKGLRVQKRVHISPNQTK
ncbi:hypothetical protein C6543_16140, partial [Escherichia coli]|nr:hypothetical protein [Escherichia coli]